MEKLKVNSNELIAVAKRILATIDETIATTPAGRRISRPTLMAKVISDCNLAHRLIEALAMPSDTEGYLAASTTATSLGAAKVTLGKMCYEPNWPSKGNFEPWLKGTVVPVLRFVIFGEVLPPGVAGPETAAEVVRSGPDNAAPGFAGAETPEPAQRTDVVLQAPSIDMDVGIDDEELSEEELWREARETSAMRMAEARAAIRIYLEQAPQDDATAHAPTA